MDKDRQSVDHIDVEYIAALARISLSDAEKASFQGQLEGIVGYVRKMQTLDLASVEPMCQPNATVNVFREDRVREGLAAEAALANAPETIDGKFKVPRIVE